MQAVATGAALRMARAGGELDPATLTAVRPAYHRLQRLEATLAYDRPPADWRLWLADALAVENDLHRGTAGVADEAFYDSIRRYATRHGASDVVLDAIAFIYGLSSWDFAEAARASGTLLEEAKQGEHWVNPLLLHDGAVIARLAIGDLEGAREASSALARFDGRSRDDLRRRLIDAWLHRYAGDPMA